MRAETNSPMLASPADLVVTPDEPFHGAVVEFRSAALPAGLHQAYEVAVLLSGGCRRQVENITLHAMPGDVSLCAPWESHAWRDARPRTRALLMHFLPDFLGEESFEGASWLTLFALSPERRPRVKTPKARALMLTIAQEIRREMHRRLPGWITAARLGLLRLLLELSRQSQPPPGQPRPIRPETAARVMPALKMMHHTSRRKITRSDAAAACGLGPSRFGHLFRQVMGMNFGSFRRHARLGWAAQLLLTTDLSIDAVAEESGFADASHLHHAFSQIYGTTPARYRTDAGRLPARGCVVLESTHAPAQPLSRSRRSR